MNRAGSIRLKWEVDSSGYKLDVPPSEGSTFMTSYDADLYLVPLGGPMRTYEVALGDHDIYVDLANATWLQGAVDFANRWGLLAGKGPEKVSEFMRVAESMAWSLSRRARGPARNALRHHHYGTVRVDTSGKALALWAHALGQFCWLERFNHDDGFAIVRCPACRSYLPTRSKRGPRKSTCSNSCRQKAYRKRLAS